MVSEWQGMWTTLVYLVLLPTALLVIVEDVLPDVLPAVVVGGDVVHALLQPFVAPPASVEENAQQQHCRGDRQLCGLISAVISIIIAMIMMTLQPN
ncbi:hypothetical protein EYF80_031399 [Liparis tanakae]|uniref:Uncharacterized protein n=1 Tax=Liparis tanakae TaxID=230148 RepID=A0A4Z2GXR9_9TELE|nr:hypothetical protein EYF80_031399 [Liparis tanakae]